MRAESAAASPELPGVVAVATLRACLRRVDPLCISTNSNSPVVLSFGVGESLEWEADMILEFGSTV